MITPLLIVIFLILLVIFKIIHLSLGYLSEWSSTPLHRSSEGTARRSRVAGRSSSD